MESNPRAASDAPVAVIDVGSNSGRVVAYLRDTAGHLRMLAGSRAPLRLAGELDADRRLTPQAEERALDALRDFRAIALGAGARRIVAVATSAVRDAANGAQFLERVERELGFELKLIDGVAEARYGFLGGIRGLPVRHGMLFDQGGGSLQVVHFRDRKALRSWSLPLGALRLSRGFLGSDPPRGREVRALLAHVRKVVAAASLPRLSEDEELVGTGGTVRNLARIDRRTRPYPIARVHGYLLKGRRLHGLAALLSGRGVGKRARIRGLSDERADSIAGGALALTVLLEALGASRVLLSGMGVREGLAYSLDSEELPEPEQVRRASVVSLASRFWGVEGASAERRAALAEALLQQLDPTAQPELAEALRDAAQLLDIGRAVDFFDRHQHTADIILETEMNGFSHRQIALTSAIVRIAGDERSEPERYAPLLDATDWAAVERAAVLLTLADDIEERCPPGGALDFECRIEAREVALSMPALGGWRPRGVGARFERVFGKALRVRPGIA